MLQKKEIILVTGATGSQGGAAAAALLRNGNTVRVIIRESSLHGPAAENLRRAGAEVVIGDMEDRSSVEAALQGAYGLFSVQGMDDGSDSTRRHTDILVAAAKKMNVQHIVHTSVNRAGEQDSFPLWEEGRWNKKYWVDKLHGEEAVRNSGIPHWTILRPVFFMDNFTPPKVSFMFPDLEKGEMRVAFKPDSKLQVVAVEDIGAFACAAFNDLASFDKQAVDVAGDELTVSAVAAAITRVSGRPVKGVYISETEAIKNGTHPDFANFQEWTNAVGYTVDIKGVKSYGLPVTTFLQYLEKKRDLLPGVSPRTGEGDPGIAVVRRNTEEVQGKGNWVLFEELFAPDFIDHTPQPGGFKADRASVLDLYQMLRKAFPDFRADIHWQTTDGDKVTTSKTYYGTHEGPFLGIAPTGRKINFDSVDVMRVRDGRITDHWGAGNLLSVVLQLGAFPDPGR